MACVALTVALIFAAGCDPQNHPTDPSSEAEASLVIPTGAIALIDMIPEQRYLGLFPGGLYPAGSNLIPLDHDSIGRMAGRRVAAAKGRSVFLSVGFSNVALEWCGPVTVDSLPPCTPWSFTGMVQADRTVRHPINGLVLFPGAMSAQTIDEWDQPGDPDYAIVNARLQAAGYVPSQVRVVWLKGAFAHPVTGLPDPVADVFETLRSLGNAIRTLKQVYPNLQQVFVSSRIYGGYALDGVDPEPYAYENGFAVKWLIESQIRQRWTGKINAVAGDLGPAVAPWIGWGPYLWANGSTPRSDGLQWDRADFLSDGTHPSISGQTKVATRLLTFFKTSRQSACWFRISGTC